MRKKMRLRNRTAYLALGLMLSIFTAGFATSCNVKTILPSDSPSDVVKACLEAYKNKNEGQARVYLNAIGGSMNTIYHDFKTVAESGKYSVTKEIVGPAKATVEIHSEKMNLLVELEKAGDTWLIVNDHYITK